MLLNLPVYWLLVRQSQHLGLALASSIGIVVYMIVLFALLVRRTENKEAGALAGFFFKICCASVLAAAAAWKLVEWLEPRIGWQTAPRAFLVLVIASAAGLALTALGGKLLRVREIDAYMSRLLSGSRKL
jgi:putative peptidoglycan lipid II flippase